MKQLNFFDSENPITKSVHIHVDGASRNNPGDSGIGFVITHGGKTLAQHGYYIGIKTNNQAEYLALLGALLTLPNVAPAVHTVVVIADSQLLVKQLTGEYRVKDPILQKIHRRVTQLLANYQVSTKHVLRHFNKHADEYANKGIDEKIAPPEYLQHEFDNLF